MPGDVVCGSKVHIPSSVSSRILQGHGIKGVSKSHWDHCRGVIGGWCGLSDVNLMLLTWSIWTKYASRPCVRRLDDLWLRHHAIAALVWRIGPLRRTIDPWRECVGCVIVVAIVGVIVFAPSTVAATTTTTFVVTIVVGVVVVVVMTTVGVVVVVLLLWWRRG